METSPCTITGCTSFGVKVMPGLVLCRYHRKRAYRVLCDIRARTQKGTSQATPKATRKAPARVSRSRAAKRERDREIRAVAMNAAGPSVYRLDVTRVGRVTECSGGLPTLGKNR